MRLVTYNNGTISTTTYAEAKAKGIEKNVVLVNVDLGASPIGRIRKNIIAEFGYVVPVPPEFAKKYDF